MNKTEVTITVILCEQTDEEAANSLKNIEDVLNDIPEIEDVSMGVPYEA